MKAVTQMTYLEAKSELTAIVDRLRDSVDVDVDKLVSDVGRAKELIGYCGSKVKNADAAIKSIVSDLQSEEQPAPAPSKYHAASRPGEEDGEIPF